jgi:adenylate kinase
MRSRSSKAGTAKVKTSGRSEKAAAKDAIRALLKLEKYDAIITGVSEYISERGNETLKLIVVVGHRTFTDCLTDTELAA